MDIYDYDCSPRKVFYDQTDCNTMEVLYERRCAKYIYVVPEGLRELMSDISREVLRCHPKEVYCFIADYLDALLVTRENAKVASLFVEDVTEAAATIEDILKNTRYTLPEAKRAVRVIQRAFRRYIAQKRGELEVIPPIDPAIIICKMVMRLNITYEKASEAAKVIQQAWKCYRMRRVKWRARFDSPVNWKEAARYTLRMYKKYAATWEYTRAATIIQAAYRGYYTRRLFKLYSKKEKCPQEEVLSYLDYYTEIEQEEDDMQQDLPGGKLAVSMETLYVMYDPQDKAARVIQKTFKKLMKLRHPSFETATNALRGSQKEFVAELWDSKNEPPATLEVQSISSSIDQEELYMAEEEQEEEMLDE